LEFFAFSWDGAEWTLDTRFAGAHTNREFEPDGLRAGAELLALAHHDRFVADGLWDEVGLGLRRYHTALVVDGIRLFDGNTSTLIGFEAIGPIFRGQTIENLGPFVGTTATYAKEEYIISDGTTTLAINLRLGTWRDLGIGCSALYAEQDTPNVIASFNFGVYALEDYSTVLDGTDAIDLEWELGAKISDISQRTIIQRVYIDIDTGGQLLTPTIVIDNTTIELPTFLTNSRELVEYSINRTCRLVGLRLTGQIEDVVNLYAVELDLAMGVSNAINQQSSQGRG